MRPGDTYVGPDGTAYLVVRVRTVAEDQLRWWVDRRESMMDVEDYQGPTSPEDLHLITSRDFGGASYGLVLP